MKIKSVAKGFTLVELLIVVVIIGILSAVALPMYRKAVEKSRVADALNTMQAVAKSEHGWYLMNNGYTKDFANLDIDLIDEDGEKAEGASYDTVNYTFTLQDSSIKAERDNKEYTLYKLYEDGNVYCLPEDHYICEQFGWGVNRKLCGEIKGAWSNLEGGHCYGSAKDRCEQANKSTYLVKPNTYYQYSYCGYFGPAGGPYLSELEVGEFEKCVSVWQGHCNNSSFTGEGSTCESPSCQNSHFNQGAICRTTGTYGCNGGYFENNSTCYGNGMYACNSSTFTAGSKCIPGNYSSCMVSVFEDDTECVSMSTNSSCNGSIFKEGSKCIANHADACKASNAFGAIARNHSYEAGSYCVGEAANSCKGLGNFQANCVANATGACSGNTYVAGSSCVGNVNDSCANFTNFKGTCIANKPGACAGNVYTDDGCCSGQYCPEDAKKCS